MNYLEGLLTRRSVPLLLDPAPTQNQLGKMLQAALRAPDHGNLKPFRFLAIQGQARHQLGQIFLQQQLARNPDTDNFTQNKVRNMPLRAPLILCLIACPQEHVKIPIAEQIQSTACAGQNILHAAYAQGLGAVWRTGWLAQDSQVHQQLGMQKTEELLGFIYLGTPKYQPQCLPDPTVDDFLQYWESDH